MDEKQYVIAESKFNREDFVYFTLVDGRILSCHNELPVQYVLRAGKIAYCLLGYAFQVDSGRKNPMEELKNVKNAAQAEDVVESWSGRWLLIYEDTIFMDACGLLGCYYTEQGILSSSIHCINEMLGKRNRDSKIRHRFGMDYFPGPGTPYPYIKRLMPSQTYCLSDNTQGRRELLPEIPLYENDEQRIDAFIQCFVTLIRNVKAEYKGKYMVPLTGGYDSRTLAALLKYNGLEFETFTLEHDNLTEDDRNIPPLLAKRAGIPYQYIRRTGKMNRKRLKAYDMHCGNMAIDEDRNFYAYHQYPEGVEKTALLRANIWECAWGHYYKQIMDFGYDLNPFKKKYVNIRWRKDMQESLGQWLDYAKTDSQNISMPQRFYREQRMGCWLSGIEQSLTILKNVDSIPLCNCSRLLAVLNSISFAMRCEKRYQVRIIEKTCPELLDIPFDQKKKAVKSQKERLLADLRHMRLSIVCLGIHQGLQEIRRYLGLKWKKNRGKGVKRKIKNFVKKVPGMSTFIRRHNQLSKARAKKEEIEKRKAAAERIFDRIRNKGQKEELDGLLKNREKPLVSIIILKRNGIGKLRSLMESFHTAVFYSKFEIVFIDNASEDDSAAYMESWKREFDITIVSNEENLSFSAANNQGAAIAKGEYLLFLNNDTVVTDYWLDELLIAACKMEHPGAFGARLIYPEALGDVEKQSKAYSVQHAGISFRDGMRKKEYMIRPYNMRQGDCMDEEETTPVRKIGVTAAVLMVNRDAYDAVNGFSEEYFYGLEDVDFCLKLHQKGYYNYYCPDCIVYHYEYGTRDKNKTPEAQKRGEHNAAVFRGKWQRYLAGAIAMDQIHNTLLFTEKPLTIAVMENRESKASKSVSECKVPDCMEALRSFGYHVYAVGDEEKRYMLDIKADVVLVFDSDYDITKLQCAKHDVVKAVWSCTEDSDGALADSQYDIVILPEMQRKPDAGMKDFVDMLQAVYQMEIDEKSIDICGAMPDNETNRFWGDCHYAEALKREFEQRGWHARVLPREKWYDRTNARYVLVLRGVRPYYPGRENGRYFIMWNISHPADVAMAEYDLFDYVYFASKKMREMLADKIKTPSGVLLQCTDTEVMSCNESADYQYELLFVGNSRHVFRQILKDLLPTEHALSVYGRHWEEFPVIDYVKGEYMDNDKVGQAYHDAKILLNDHWDDMQEYGIISNRIFDALSVGAFVISDAVPGMDEILQGAVVTYEGRADLLEKIDYYLEHEDERRQKAARGQEIVRSQHTFACRVQQILEDIGKR